MAEDDEFGDDEFSDDEDNELEDDIEEDLEDDEFEDDEFAGDDDDESDDSDADEDTDENADEALEELEAEELELGDDEQEGQLLVDEAATLRAIRREELTLDVDAQGAGAGEFVCQSCFLVKRMTQLANKKKMYCLDCAS